VSLIAQDEIIFKPSELTPHEDGYYIAGFNRDKNGDGIPEFYNKCDDEYEDDLSDGIYDPHVNHEETGEQQSFKYFNCLIMPTCVHKSDPITPPVDTGYIQMSACQFTGTDTAILSYIQSPPINNLVSIYLETSADVSINESDRKIPYKIEYSKDFGTTWEKEYIYDDVKDQGGYRVTYDSESSILQTMIDASKLSPIVLRIITNDRSQLKPYQGQFVKLHALKITGEIGKTNIRRNFSDDLNIQIRNLTIYSDESVSVFNIMGQYIGTGMYIQVPASGIYLVRTENGPVQKILVK
jgi:hypothetical protein